jgi:hypothetical protein
MWLTEIGNLRNSEFRMLEACLVHAVGVFLCAECRRGAGNFTLGSSVEITLGLADASACSQDKSIKRRQLRYQEQKLCRTMALEAEIADGSLARGLLHMTCAFQENLLFCI